MKRTRENLEKVLDLLCTNPSPTHAARGIGASDKILWLWLRQSAADEANGVPAADSPFAVCWPDPDEPPTFFHLGFMQAQKIFLALASCEHLALIGPNAGHTKVARDGSGKITFKVDLKIASDAMQMDDFTWELVYGTRAKSDIFARDADGCLVPDTYTEPLPAQLRIHLLRSLLPSQFNPEQRSTSEVHHSGGVLVVGEAKIAKQPNALRDDLESRLAAIRAAKNGERVTTPSHPIPSFKANPSDPPERISGVEEPTHNPEPPRAYQAPALPAPKPEPPKDFRRPTRNLTAQDRTGMPPGGVSVTTGRPT